MHRNKHPQKQEQKNDKNFFLNCLSLHPFVNICWSVVVFFFCLVLLTAIAPATKKKCTSFPLAEKYYNVWYKDPLSIGPMQIPNKHYMWLLSYNVYHAEHKYTSTHSSTTERAAVLEKYESSFLVCRGCRRQNFIESSVLAQTQTVRFKVKRETDPTVRQCMLCVGRARAFLCREFEIYRLGGILCMCLSTSGACKENMFDGHTDSCIHVYGWRLMAGIRSARGTGRARETFLGIANRWLPI